MAEERTSNYIKLCDEWAEKFLQMDKEELENAFEKLNGLRLPLGDVGYQIDAFSCEPMQFYFGIVMTNLKHRRIFCSITVRLILIMWRVRYLQLKWGYVVWQNWQDCL